MNNDQRRFIMNRYDDIGRVYIMSQKLGTDLFMPCLREDKNYYSVTTALGATKDKSYLVDWRKRIGDEEADKQVAHASVLGEAFHECGERFFLKDKSKPVDPQIPLIKLLWRKMEPKLKPVEQVHSVEQVLYSDHVRLAGRGDAVVVWNGDLCILDFKCINSWKKDWLEDYWLQCTIYAHMWEMMYGIRPTKIVLAIANKKLLQTKIFEGNPNDYAKEAVKRIQAFHAM